MFRNQRRPRGGYRHQDNKDGCFELCLFIFFFYIMFDMWIPECTWFFN